MAGVKLCLLLLHLGACPEPIAWAGSREISAETLAACPRGDWREWMAAALKVKIGDDWATWERAAKQALSGDGYGDGYGSGYGDGYGDGADLVASVPVSGGIQGDSDKGLTE